MGCLIRSSAARTAVGKHCEKVERRNKRAEVRGGQGCIDLGGRGGGVGDVGDGGGGGLGLWGCGWVGRKKKMNMMHVSIGTHLSV